MLEIRNTPKAEARHKNHHLVGVKVELGTRAGAVEGFDGLPSLLGLPGVIHVTFTHDVLEDAITVVHKLARR